MDVYGAESQRGECQRGKDGARVHEPQELPVPRAVRAASQMAGWIPARAVLASLMGGSGGGGMLSHLGGNGMGMLCRRKLRCVSGEKELRPCACGVRASVALEEVLCAILSSALQVPEAADAQAGQQGGRDGVGGTSRCTCKTGVELLLLLTLWMLLMSSGLSRGFARRERCFEKAHR